MNISLLGRANALSWGWCQLLSLSSTHEINNVDIPVGRLDVLALERVTRQRAERDEVRMGSRTWFVLDRTARTAAAHPVLVVKDRLHGVITRGPCRAAHDVVVLLLERCDEARGDARYLLRAQIRGWEDEGAVVSQYFLVSAISNSMIQAKQSGRTCDRTMRAPRSRT